MKQIIFPFFTDKDRENLENKGYKIVEIKESPVIRGHGGDVVVTVSK